MKSTIIITVWAKNYGVYRDVRTVYTSDLIILINDYLSKGYEIIALEEFDGDIEDFYNKTLTDDDIDAMAADIPA